MIFGVAIPGSWAKYSGDWLIVNCLPLLNIIRSICYPLIVVLEWFDPLVRRLAGVPLRDEKSYADELEQEILKVVSEGELHGAVDEEENDLPRYFLLGAYLVLLDSIICHSNLTS